MKIIFTLTRSFFIEKLGKYFIEKMCGIGHAIFIIFDCSRYFFKLYERRVEWFKQMFNISIKSFFIVGIVAFFTGMILALQAGLILQRFSQEFYVATIVTETMWREMGPFMTALILAASVGSSYTAEIGTMKISEEISALKLMNINPTDFLVMPKFFAFIIMCPVLTLFTNVIGTLGGMLVAYTQLNIEMVTYYNYSLNLLEIKAIYMSLFKAFIFAILIVAISSHQGFITKNGAIGVGIATRRAVVLSFIYILISGYFITRLFY